MPRSRCQTPARLAVFRRTESRPGKRKALLLALLLALPGAVSAQNLQWRPNGSTTGGSGTWDTTSNSWYNGTSLLPWNNAAAYSATFGGNAGIVTLGGPITVQDVTFATDGYTLTGSTLTFAGSNSTVTTSGGTDTIASILAGTGALTKAGAGTLVLTGTNTYAGGTYVNGGVLEVSADSNLGASSGGLNLNAGTLSADGTFSSARNVTLNVGNGTINVAAHEALTLSGVISGIGTAGLSVTGGGILALTGNNTYSGSTTIAAGATLQVGANTTTGVLGGAATDNGALVFNRSNAYTYAGVISGSGIVQQSGTGTTTLSGTNSYAGTTLLNAGTLAISADANLGAATGDIVFNGGTLQSTNNITSARNVTLNAAGIFNANASTTLTLSGIVSGAGGLTKIGNGAMAVTGNNTFQGAVTVNAGSLTLSGTNTYTGGTFLNGGTLQVYADANLGAASNAITLGSGTIFSVLTGFTTHRNLILNGGMNIYVNSGQTFTINGVISGPGGINRGNPGVLVLTGDNTYSGGTGIGNGTTSVSSDANLGATSSGLTFSNASANGANLNTTNTFATDRAVTLGSGGGAFNVNAGTTLTLNGIITGAGQLYKSYATGTLIITGNNNYSGGTYINAGVVQVASASNLGTGTLNLGGGTLYTTNDILWSPTTVLSSTSTLDMAPFTTLTLAGAVSGGGGFIKTDTGTLVLSANNVYTGLTNIAGGTLQIGAGSTTGTLGTNNVTDTSDLVFNRAGGYTYGGVISGAGTLELIGPGTITLTGNNSYTGATTISSGALYLNGNQANATGVTNVGANGTLGGAGTIGGSVNMAGGGTLDPGSAPGVVGTLTINGGLTLGSGSILNYQLGQPNVVGGALNDLTTVKGNLTLAGTLNVTQTTGGVFGVGVYRLFNYSGSLTNDGLNIGTTPLPASQLSIQTSVADQVNLVVSRGAAAFWDGGNPNNGNGTIVGGSGTWQGVSGNSNWTNASGATAGPWTDSAFAVFEGTPGAVTIDSASAGAINVAGMQFTVGGYTLTGGTINLIGEAGQATLDVGDGTAAGTGYTATIDSVLAGSARLMKTDLGTLVLSGSNTYTGGTLINQGTLQVAADANLGDASGDLSFANGATLSTTNSFASARNVTLGAGGGTFSVAAGTTLSLSGLIADGVGVSGSLTKAGGGTLVLTNAETYSGGTSVSGGTLQLGNGSTNGTVVGNIATVSGAAVAFDPTGSTAYAGVISGPGALQTLAGTTILTGVNTYTGGSTINVGSILQLGNNSAGSITGNIADNGILAFNATGTTNYTGIISGTGAMQQNVTGTTNLSGANTYSGGTFINAGSLGVSNDNNLGAGGVTVNGGQLAGVGPTTLTRNISLTSAGGGLYGNAGTLTMNGIISGAGSGELSINGSVVLAGTNTYTGTTRINPGAILTISSVANLGANGGTANDLTNNQGQLIVNSSLTLNGPYISAASLNVTSGNTLTLTGSVAGNGVSLVGAGGTVLVLGTASATSTWTVNQGTLQIGNGGTGAGVFGPIALGGSNTLIINNSDTYTDTNVISGTGSMRQIGSGTTVFTNTNTYAGGTTIMAGTLQLGNGSTAGSIVGDVTDNGSLAFNRSNAYTYAGTISGSGAVQQNGSGTLILSGTNTYTGGTTLNAGTLQLSANANLGDSAGMLTFNGGTLATTTNFTLSRVVTLNPGGGSFDVANNTTLIVAGDMSGNGGLTKTDGGTLVLSGADTYTGGTTLSIGTLYVDGSTTSATTVATGTTLGGAGTITGDVTVNGTLSPHDATGAASTLTIHGNLVLGSGATLNYTFGQVNNQPYNSLVNVSGNLTTAGLLNVTTPAGGTFAAGLYRVFNYTGTLTNNGLAMGQVPPATSVSLQMNVPSQVNLINTTGQLLAFWDGGDPSRYNNSVVDGGNGIWNSGVGSNSNWTDANGAVNAPYTNGSFAVFQGSPGTVTVDDSLGQVTASGLQFVVSGYTVTGGAITLVPAATQETIRAGSGAPSDDTLVATIDAVLQGNAELVKTDAGTLILGGANTYTGGTDIQGGRLQISADDNLGAAGTALTFDGSTLATTGTFSSTRPVTINAAGGTFDVDAATTLTLSGAIHGAGTLTKIDTGTLVLSGTNTYLGGTDIYGGTVQVAADTNLGDVSGQLALDGGTLHTTLSFASARGVTLNDGGGTIDVDPSTVLTLNGTVSGTGTLTKIDGGTLVLTGANTYAGPNTYTGGNAIDGGTVQITADDNLGAADGALSFDGGTLATRGNFSSARTITLNSGGGSVDVAAGTKLTLTGAIGGNGALTKTDGGTLVLTDTQNTYSGATSVSFGALYVDGSIASATSVAAGGTLGGIGTVGGNVTVASGGTLGPGKETGAPGTLTLNGNLLLNSGAILAYGFGQANVVGGPYNDLTVVNGNLTLAGSLNITTPPGGSFDPGIYRVINYTGTLVNNGLTVGTAPIAVSNLSIQTSASGQINLVVTTGEALTYWDGGAAANKFNNRVDGGDGSWQSNSGNDNWTDETGATNAGWANGSYAIFEGAPGTVTIDGSQGNVSASGMQFAVNGYHLNGDPLTLDEISPGTGQTIIRVGDGTAAGSGYVATIGAILEGSTELVKADLGTLVLGGANTYTGGTDIQAGTLQIAADDNLGVAGSGLAFEGGTLHTTALLATNRPVTLNTGGGSFDVDPATTLTLNGVIDGNGALTKLDTGTLILANTANTYTGGTVINDGVVQVAMDSNLGDLSGGLSLGGGTLNTVDTFSSARAVVLNPGGGSFDVDPGTTLTLSGNIGGVGSLTKLNTGTLVLTGANNYSGGTTLAAGTLQIGDGGTAGTLGSGNLTDNGLLVFDRSDTVTYAGTITGNGDLHQTGTGTTVLTGANSYTGPTTLYAGALYIQGNESAATGTVAVGSGAILGGTGSVGGQITVANGGTLAPGAVSGAPGTLTLGGGLNLSSGAILSYQLGQANTVGGSLNDLIQVNGNLTLAGTLNVATTPGGAFDAGVYRLINYSGALVDNGLSFGIVPVPVADLSIQTEIGGQVNLVNTDGLPVNFWDGGDLSHRNNGVIDGGDGTWQAAAGNDNWTDATGSVNAPYVSGSFAIFQGKAGQVNVDDSLGEVIASGLQFAVNGYAVNGDPITLTATTPGTGQTLIRVGDGTAAGSSYTATIHAVLQGDTELVKTDLGTLVLGGVNTYTGGTAIDGGTLQVAADTNLGAASGALSFNDGTLQTTASFSTARSVTLNAGGGSFSPASSSVLTLNGVMQGDGALTKNSGGSLVLAGANTYTGSTTVNGGTLEAGAPNVFAQSSRVTVNRGGTLDLNSYDQAAQRLSGAGAIILGSATLTEVNPTAADDTTFSGSLSGSGGLIKAGAGSLTLSGPVTYTGETQLEGGSLILDGSAGSLRLNGNVTGQNSASLSLINGARLTGWVDPADLTIDAASTWTITASSTANNLSLAGQATFIPRTQPFAAARTLTVTNLVGQGGMVGLYVALANANSVNDQIIVDGGTASGLTHLNIINAGGLGNETAGDGIPVVVAENGGTTGTNAFELDTKALLAGPYQYVLQRGAPDAPHNWYLTDMLTPPGDSGAPIPDFRPETSLYSVLSGQALGYGEAMIGSLHERMGALDELDTRSDPYLWARVVAQSDSYDGAAQVKAEQSAYATDVRSNLGIGGVQVGGDLFVTNPGNGRGSVGLYGAIGRNSGTVDHKTVDGATIFAGNNVVKGYSVGAYSTWLDGHGGYVDAVLQGTHYDVTSNATEDGLSLRTNGNGWAASLEVGKRFALAPRLDLEPEAQVIHQSVDLDRGNDQISDVAFQRADSTLLRLGARLSHALDTASATPASLSLSLNMLRNTSGRAQTNFATPTQGEVPFTNDYPGTRAQLLGRVDAQITRMLYFHAQLSIERSVDTSHLTSVGGQFGVKLVF